MLRSKLAVTATNGVIKKAMYLNGELIGSSPAMVYVFHLIRRVANSDISVLVTGATGTGKEMIAQAIHQQSKRAKGLFMVVNCGAIPRELLESELFGHERGAFTGAFRSVAGKVELAHCGTLFLDEVGELPLEMQVKLLRFLQDFTFERVGSRETKKVDVRVIAATNCDLKEALAKGRFREDLYYRLDGISIELPSLKERGDDVIILAEAFLRRFADEAGKKIHGFSPKALQAFQLYSWPGNVRELISCIRRAVVLAEGPRINLKDLGLVDKAGILLESQNGNGLGLREVVNRFEAKLISETLYKCQGNVKQAAKALKTSQSVIYHLIKKHGFNNDSGVHVQ
jgi:two-component system NtrC family response regulator